MKRLVVLFGCMCLASPAFAITEFSKEWKDRYMDADAKEDFILTARRAGCNVCHIKGEKKTEHNEYGLAVKEFLDKEEFPTEWVKANPDKAREKIVEGLKKAGEKQSKDGKKFADKIKEGELPATDAGL